MYGIKLGKIAGKYNMFDNQTCETETLIYIWELENNYQIQIKYNIRTIKHNKTNLTKNR